MSSISTRRVMGIAVAAGSLLALVGCSPDPEGGAGDAPIASVQKDPWMVLNNIDGFPNVATRCHGPNGIYVTRSSGDATDALVVIPDDPACGPGGATTEGTGSEPSGTSLPR